MQQVDSCLGARHVALGQPSLSEEALKGLAGAQDHWLAHDFAAERAHEIGGEAVAGHGLGREASRR